MKLYYSPGACSLAPHIALIEAKLDFEAVKVDLRAHKLADGSDYYAVNPKGYVPLLALDDGTKLTEVAVLLQYIADRKPGTLAPAFGSMDRWKLMEWLNFISSEIHKGLSPLWNPAYPAEAREQSMEKLGKRLDFLSTALANREYLHGNAFTIADAYLFTVLSWSKPLKVDLARWPALGAYLDRIGARPSVQEARRRESGGTK